MEFEELYNSACGIVGISYYDDLDDFLRDLKRTTNNRDFSLVGYFDTTQEADEELLSLGFTLDQITKMSLNQYGNVIVTLLAPDDTQSYWVFIGAR